MASIFGGKLGNFFAATKPEPVVPGFAKAVARGEILLVELVAFETLGEDTFHGKIASIENRVGRANRSRVVRVTRGGHR